MGFIAFKLDSISKKIAINIMDVFMALVVPTKVLCNVWSYHIYNKMLSTE